MSASRPTEPPVEPPVHGGVSMRELLASCEAARAVSRPPCASAPSGPERPVRPEERRAA
ncbi:hypothetical protein [Streptomyces cellostaticus]|uniref:hypothetical protein n=1 Tax=Streptomyces TaxID=1883 RepID=UPI0020260AD6|nr:hypothetical protein [Streptomyces cellostaticus]